MPAEVILFPERNLALFRHVGVSLADDCISAINTFIQMPGYRPEMAHLVDLSGVTEAAVDFNSMPGLVMRAARLGHYFTQGLHCAIYAPDDVSFGFARMYQQLAEQFLPFQTGVFHDAAGALAHAGQDISTLDALNPA